MPPHLLLPGLVGIDGLDRALCRNTECSFFRERNCFGFIVDQQDGIIDRNIFQGNGLNAGMDLGCRCKWIVYVAVIIHRHVFSVVQTVEWSSLVDTIIVEFCLIENVCFLTTLYRL
ncbi:MAG: hypothetical protein ACLVEJ_04845 [Parabacteroides sp.]